VLSNVRDLASNVSLPSFSRSLSELRINTSRSRSASLVETQPRRATAVLGRVAPAWVVTVRQTRDRRLRLSTRGDGIATPTFPGILRSGKRVPLRAAGGHTLPVRHGVIRVEGPSKSTCWAIVGVTRLRGTAHKGKAVGRHVGVWKGAATNSRSKLIHLKSRTSTTVLIRISRTDKAAISKSC
jgi:hypothetical protein